MPLPTPAQPVLELVIPMIHLESVVMREIRLPLRETFHISSGSVQNRRILLLQLQNACGTRVWSECVAGEYPNYSPETIETAWLALELWLIPEVLGRSFHHPSEVHRLLDSKVRGHRMAKAAVEMGFWALAAELADKSLSRFIGGTRSTVEVGVSLGIEPTPEKLTARAVTASAEGYRKIKLKIKPGFDIDFVRAVRRELPSAALMVDANASYRLKDAEHLVNLDAYALTMIEQPFQGEDLIRHSQLQVHLNTPICLDESITSPERVDDMIALESARIVNIKPGRVGGFTSSLEIHQRCRRAGIPVWCGGMLESGIGRAYNVALASLPNFKMPGDLSPSRRYWSQDIVFPEWTMGSDGTVEVPTRAGIGVEVDAERVDALTVRSRAVSNSGHP